MSESDKDEKVRSPKKEVSWEEITTGSEDDPRKKATETFLKVAPGAISYMGPARRAALRELLTEADEKRKPKPAPAAEEKPFEVSAPRVSKTGEISWVTRSQVDTRLADQGKPPISDEGWNETCVQAFKTLQVHNLAKAAELEALDDRNISGAAIRHRTRVRGQQLAEQQMREEDAEKSGVAPGADWTPIPLSEVSGKPLNPQFGLREDYAACFYPRKLNLVFGESESGKTWLALLAAIQTVQIGGRVVMIDFEDSADSIKSRLYVMGLEEHEEGLITYINPTTSLSEEGRDKLAEFLVGADLCIIDATSEGMAAYGLSSNSDVEVAEFYGALPKWAARQGPAVILIDHTPKSSDNRGGPQGSQHKRAGVDGAAMYVENVVKFGEGVGQSRVWINKDKHAGVRKNALVKGLWADLNCEPGEGFVLRVPKDNAGAAVAKAATDSQKLEEAIREVLVENGGNYIPVRDMKTALRDRGAPGSNGDYQDAYKAYKDARE